MPFVGQPYHKNNSSSSASSINEFKVEIPNITNLATTAVFSTVENKIPAHSNYINTLEFNKLEKRDFNNKLNNSNKKVTSNKAKYIVVGDEFKKMQDKVEKLRTSYSNLFIGQSPFSRMKYSFT